MFNIFRDSSPAFDLGSSLVQRKTGRVSGALPFLLLSYLRLAPFGSRFAERFSVPIRFSPSSAHGLPSLSLLPPPLGVKRI